MNIKKPYLLFLGILAAEFLYILWITLSHRLFPHDSFYYITLQYYFLNNVVQTGEIPQWIPYLSHGTTAAWWHIIQGMGSLTQNVLLHTGPLFKNINLLPIAYWGIYFDEITLAVGMWLLSRHFFSSGITCAFVTLAAIGSSVWASNVLFNLHLFHTLPLVLFFLHSFFKKSNWLYLFLALNLYALSLMNSLIYFVAPTSLAIFLYCVFYYVFNVQEVRSDFRRLKWDLRAFFFILLTAASFVLMYCFAAAAIDAPNQIFGFEGRSQEGSVNVHQFAATGDLKNLFLWLDLFLGISPTLDYTIYIGLLPAIMFFFVKFNKSNLHLAYLILIFIGLSLGGFVASVLYYWPFMPYFRHLTPCLAILKPFLCLLAGFGFDNLLKRIQQDKNPVSSGLPALILILALSCLLWSIFSYETAQAMMRKTILAPAMIFTKIPYTWFAWRTIAVIAGALLLFFILSKRNSQRPMALILYCLLILHCADVFSYKIMQTYFRTFPITPLEYQLFSFQPLPFQDKRTAIEIPNAREILLNTDRLNKHGSTYWNIDAFLFKDNINFRPQTSNWQKPFDRYLRASGITASDLKISGFNAPKVQFFSKVLSVPENIIIENDPGKNYRRELPYEVQRFDSNNFILKVFVPRTENTIWMLYSDVWHPGWQATINGNAVPILKANSTYKAVELRGGENLVHFKFSLPFVAFLQSIIGINSLFLIGVILKLLPTCCDCSRSSRSHP